MSNMIPNLLYINYKAVVMCVSGSVAAIQLVSVCSGYRIGSKSGWGDNYVMRRKLLDAKRNHYSPRTCGAMSRRRSWHWGQTGLMYNLMTGCQVSNSEWRR